MARRESFDPDDIRKEDMKQLADAIEEYRDSLMSVMVIPDDILEDCKDKFKEALRRTDKLIKKLRKGDKSIFKDADEVNGYI